MAKLNFIFIFGAIFLPGLYSDSIKSHLYPDSYLVGDVPTFHERDPISGEIIKYEIVPLSLRREKRESEVKEITHVDIPLPSTTVSSSVSSVSTASTSSSATNLSTESPVHVWLNATQIPPVPSTEKNKPNLFGEPPSPELKFPWNYPSEDELKQKNYTTQKDNETNSNSDKYYSWSIVQNGEGLWIDLDKKDHTKVHEMLSNSHRRAATLILGFELPYYGHRIKNVTLATGGFIYLGDQIHSWLAATQYAAPLMGNFDSSLSNSSSVRYASTDTELTVEWTGIHLQDTPDKPFTFQATFFANGTILFAYKSIPIPISQINDTNHPVKVGLSEAYIRDKLLIFIKQKTIYEYARVDLLKNGGNEIKNGTAIIFTPFPTCLNFNTCNSCVQSKTNFTCVWCDSVRRCSDGMDRYRQEWVVRDCEKNQKNTTEACSRPIQSTEDYHHIDFNTDVDNHRSYEHDMSHGNHFPESPSSSSTVQRVKVVNGGGGMSAGGVIATLFIVMLVFLLVGWVGYAYFFPHTPSGQLLIRYRPSQWSLSRNTRYTAASIHM